MAIDLVEHVVVMRPAWVLCNFLKYSDELGDDNLCYWDDILSRGCYIVLHPKQSHEKVAEV